MKTSLTLIAAMVFALAGSLNADLNPIDGQLQEISIDLDGNVSDFIPFLGPSGPAPLYSNMDTGPDGYVAFAPATGSIGTDDYTSIASPRILATEFRFVGGVAAVGGSMTFTFSDGGFSNGFSVALPQAGNFIWTITLGDGLILPGAGTANASVDGTTTSGGQWFLGNAGATIGSTILGTAGSPGFETGTFDNNFEITGTQAAIPEPSSAIAICAIGLGLISRRRR